MILVSLLCFTIGLAYAEIAAAVLPTVTESMRVSSQNLVAVLVAQTEEKSEPAVTEQKPDPASSGDVQERSIMRPPMPGGARPGGPMKAPPPKAVPFTCSPDGVHCYCFGEVDCFDLRRSGLCVTWLDDRHCLTTQ